jgi:acetoin utilization deacetylase AcuC-like enzyme/GNAT superfamily N-acetyltransferase
MIRFRRIYDLSSDADKRQFSEAAQIFRAAFPYEAEAIDRVERLTRRHAQLAFEPILLISQDRQRRPTGLAFVYYFGDLKYGYLQYIASNPRQPGRGIGGALYEALREVLAAKGARGLFLDVPPVNPEKLKDPSRLAANRKRIQFYARYGLKEIANTLWDCKPNPRNGGYLTTFLFDPLGKPPRLSRQDARRMVQRVLVEQFSYKPEDPFVKEIVGSFKEDPLRLIPLAPAVKSVPPSKGVYVATMKMVVVEKHVIHHLREKGYVERPVRVSAILEGVEGMAIERVACRRFGEDHVLAVHDRHLINYLRAMSRHLDEKAIIYPEVFPIRRPDRVPRALEDRAGYFCADTFTPLTKNSYPAARNAADVALTGAALLVAGDRLAYALCRPPGHHAERRIFGGFCFLNNAAIAAHYLSRHGKVVLLDIDYHHGNGSQDIFYSRSDVYTISIHGHPSHAYPNFSGYADERGEGDGLGFNRNYPLEPPVDDERYLNVLDEAIGVIRRFSPRFLVVAMGFDIMKGDPTGAFSLTVAAMRRVGERLSSVRLPTLVVQEGGYSLRNLRIGSRGFFTGLAGA